MKPFQLSWFLGTLSYVILGVFRRSEMMPGVAGLVAFILLILMTGSGAVLGMVSWKHRQVNAWWTAGAVVLNTVVLAGTFLHFTG